MHMSRLLHRVVLTLGLAALVLPTALEAQLREIVSKSVSASSSGAALALEFADEGALEISLENGTVLVNDESVGSYSPGDALDAAWREMLGDAMALENGALAEMLSEWTLPEDVSSAMATEIEAALGQALEEADVEASEDDVTVDVSVGDQTTLVRALLGSASRLGILEDALAGIDSEFRVHVDEDVVVPEGTDVRGTIVMIEGTLRIDGQVHGDVVVVGGALDLRDSGVIHGEARVADARILRNSGEIHGGLVDVLEEERDVEQELRDRLREEIRAELRSDLRNEIRNVTRFDDDDSFSIMSPLRPVLRGVGGVLEKLILVFVLGLLGAGFLAFAGENMDTITETARRAPGRAAMVGFAGSFLLIPVWILGAVALAISIIGIPVAIAWLPLFPLAAVLAAILGYVAVARVAGEWLADSNFPWTGWIRKSNPIFTLFGGLLGLTLAFMAAHVVSIAPFLGVFSGLLFVIGGIVTFLAIQIGFGAVLLTRGGRRREYQGVYDPDAAWEAAMSVDVEDDLGTTVGTDEDVARGEDGKTDA
jgi:hypothetical protein